MISLAEENSLFLTLYEHSAGDIFEPSSYQTDKALKSFIEENKGLLIIPNDINEKTLNMLIATIKELNKLGFNLSGKMIAIQMNSDSYFTTTELEYLIEIEQYLNDNNAELVIKAEDLFYLEDILEANDKLDAEVSYINSLTVSHENNRPLNEMEKFLMAYDFCTNFKYKDNEDRSKSRNITSVLNSDNIVCVGYAKLLTELCHRLNIECYNLGVTCYDETTKQDEGHENNIVVLNNKIYYADSCWDAQRKNNKGLKLYNHCLIPMEDRNKIRDIQVSYTEYHALVDVKNDYTTAKKYLKCFNNIDDENIRKVANFIFKFINVIDNSYFIKQSNNKKKPNSREKVKVQLELTVEYLSNHQEGKAIPYETFEKSLYNIYIAKGMSEKSAKNLLDRTMEINRKRALKCFNDNAQNCFVSERIQEYKL